MNRDTPEHQCRQGRRCKARIKDDAGEFHGAGVDRPDSLCKPCEEHAFAAIRSLRSDYLMLTIARTRTSSTVSGPKVSGSGERPIPIPLPVDTLMTAIDNEATRWALRITRGDSLDPHPARQVLECLKIVCANLGTLVDLPEQVVAAYFPYPFGGDWDGRLELDGVDAVLRLASFHYRAEKILGLEQPRANWLRESCHVCGRATLVSDLGAATITCKSCQNVWDQDEFARLNNPLVAA
ncbi:hypothetical protein [Nocardia sp. NPDC057440]|uniref:hypothetical protein n=1 Tax=Nocardia sp. NPDC057440 TaxID=3346134 RepID=UPI003672A53D